MIVDVVYPTAAGAPQDKGSLLEVWCAEGFQQLVVCRRPANHDATFAVNVVHCMHKRFFACGV